MRGVRAESWLRWLLVHYYAVIALWGLIVLNAPPRSAEIALGETYTIIWALCALLGGVACAIAAFFQRRAFMKSKPTSLFFRGVEMFSAPFCAVAVLMYNALQVAYFVNGEGTRLGIAVILHLVAIPALARTVWLFGTQLSAIVADIAKKHDERL